MARSVYCSVVAAWLLAGVAVSAEQGAGWTAGLFSESRHEFGMVPRGVKVKHDFVLTNRLAEPITILSLRPSCGCTSGRASTSVVAAGQSAVIEAEMDTRNFVGPKSTVLFVSLVTSRGHEAEVGLAVTANILSDIVLNPGAIDFGTIMRGQTPTQVLTIDRINAPGWRFVRMVSGSKSLNGQLVETGRKDGAVSYALSVGLKPDTPAGLLREEIRLISNDSETPSIPVLVTAWVRGDLTGAPSVLSLGQLRSSSAVQGRFVVRASRPFVISAVEGAGDGFSVSLSDQKALPVHVVTVAYKPDEGTAKGDIRHRFRVHTDLAGEPPLDLTATLRVAP
jgi:Protein of unknown function (DUF1573)